MKGCGSSEWKGIRVTGYDDSLQQVTIERTIIDDADTTLYGYLTESMVVDECNFSARSVGIVVDSCENFFLTKTDIASPDENVIIRRSGGTAEIKENYLADAEQSVLIEHTSFKPTKLSCNIFYNYGVYGVNARYCNLGSIGDSLTGAGNQFITYSADTNHQFMYFKGISPIKYWCDSSAGFSLFVDTYRNATADTALSDGCKEEKFYLPVIAAAQETENKQDKGGSAIVATIPNPAGNNMTVSYQLENGIRQAELVLRDMYGSAIGRYRLNISGTQQNVSFTEVANGIYFITLLADGKLIETKKMIVLH